MNINKIENLKNSKNLFSFKFELNAFCYYLQFKKIIKMDLKNEAYFLRKEVLFCQL